MESTTEPATGGDAEAARLTGTFGEVGLMPLEVISITLFCLNGQLLSDTRQ
jgi:hypothetical protein